MQNIFSIDGLCGALLVGQFEAKDITMIQQKIKHLVIVDGPAPKNNEIGCVESDYLEGSILGLSHLIETGAKRIMIFTVQKSHYFTHALELASQMKSGEPVEISIIYDCLSSQDTYDSVKRLVGEGKTFDGIFTTDEFAIGAMKALHEMKIAIPGQVKIVGFDDTHYASFMTPTLTSIRIDKYRLGIEAVTTLVSMIRTKNSMYEIKKVIRPSLIIRESTIGVTNAAVKSRFP